MSGEMYETQVSGAQQFCLIEEAWLLKTCHTALWERRVPESTISSSDLAHIVYLKCGKVPEQKWLEVENPRAYVTAIVRNEANDIFNKDNREIAMDVESPANSHVYSKAHTPEKEMNAAILVDQLVSKLSPDERDLFRLRFYEQRPSKEIAQIKRTTNDAIRKQLQRLTDKLKILAKANDAKQPKPHTVSDIGSRESGFTSSPPQQLMAGLEEEEE